MDKRKIRAFSKAALTYDESAWLQRQMWDGLLQQLKALRLSPNFILDIGTGTGEHTYELAKSYPSAFVIGFDIALGMVKYATIREPRSSNRPFVLQADLNEMPFKENYFDIAASNVVYQRVRHLTEAFLAVKRTLRPKGFFCISILTKNTLSELHRSFERAYKKVKGTQLPKVHGHPADSAVISSLKKAGFSIFNSNKFRKRPTYKSTYEILKWLKGIGANHHYENWIKGIEGRTVLKEMDRIYRDNYSSGGKIYATFEGLIICARRKD